VQPKKHSKFSHGNRINWEKEVKTGNMRYLPDKETLDLLSDIKKYESPLVSTVPLSVVSTKSMGVMTQGYFSNPRVHSSNSFPERSAMQRL